MDQNLKVLSRRKFIGDAAAIGALGALGVGAVVSSCSRKTKYKAPILRDQAPDGKVLKAGLVGCGGRGTGAALNFLNAGPNLELTALGDLYPHRLETCRNALLKRKNVEVPDQNCFVGFDAYKK